VSTADTAAVSYGYQWWVGTAADDPHLVWRFGGQLIEVCHTTI